MEAPVEDVTNEEALSIDYAPVEEATEETIEEAPAEISEPEDEEPATSVPLQNFEVTEHSASEITLDKAMDPVVEENVYPPVIVGEDHITAHPSEAPQEAPSEVEAENTADQTTPTEENDENTTTE